MRQGKRTQHAPGGTPLRACRARTETQGRGETASEGSLERAGADRHGPTKPRIEARELRQPANPSR